MSGGSSKKGALARLSPSDRIKCLRGGEWALRSAFSNNQLGQFDARLRHGSASVGNSGISCRQHTGGLPPEIKCQGPCGKYQIRDMFSKNARSGRTKVWCRKCIDWQLSNEPGHFPLAPPNSYRDAAERNARARELVTSLGYGDGDSAFVGNGSSIRQAFGSESDARTSGGDAESIITDSSQAGGADIASRLADFDLGGLVLDDDVSRSGSARYQASSVRAGTAYIGARPPPHMQAQEQRQVQASRAPHWSLPDMDGPSQASYHASSAPSAGTPSIGGPPQRGQQAPVRFNAIGPQGQVDTRYKAPTMSSDTASNISTVRQEAKTRKGWAKPPQRKTEISAEPAYYVEEAGREPEYVRDDDFESDDEI